MPNLRWKSPKVSGLLREYSRFAETIGGDWFDHDCRPTLAAEKLADLHDTHLARETVRQWMITAGLWKDRRARL